MLSLTRQKLPVLVRDAGFALRDVWKGGYVLKQPEDGAAPDVVMLASGSEVSLACVAGDKLAAGGIRSRVVSVPCLELLLEQSKEYRAGLIPSDGTPLVAIEAGVGESFRRLVGSAGLIYGISRFGASAPAACLAEEFGFTPDALADAVSKHVKGGS